DRLRAPRRELRGLVDADRGRLARGPPGAEQLLGADEVHVEELAREVLQARIARARAEQVRGEERAEVPRALATAQRPQGELGLLRVMAADRVVRENARDRVHR